MTAKLHPDAPALYFSPLISTLAGALIGALLGALLGAGCTAPRAARLSDRGPAPGCALGVPGATAVAENTEDGVALRFTSSTRAEELRARARDAAAQHGPGMRAGRGHGGLHRDLGAHGLQLAHGPAATTIPDNLDDGARIRFIPNDPHDRQALRERMRDRAAAMNAASCP